jgi:hypothetical protein
MSTITKNATESYVLWDEIPAEASVYLQNIGGSTAEVNFNPSLPLDNAPGIVLHKESLGVTITLSPGDLVYIKAELGSSITSLVAVL